MIHIRNTMYGLSVFGARTNYVSVLIINTTQDRAFHDKKEVRMISVNQKQRESRLPSRMLKK